MLSSDTWLNERIMDTTQTAIWKTLGTECRKRVKPYKVMSQEHVQLLHDDNNHWFLSFCLKGRVQI